MAVVMVVDDDRAIRSALGRSLRLDGHEVVEKVDGVEAIEYLASRGVDLLIADVSMPEMDGLELVSRLRQGGSALPILMLTARTGVDDRVAGLDAGADDYLSKPFEVPELRARVRALLRRPAPLPAQSSAYGIRIDESSRKAWYGEEELELTRTEFNLLTTLVGAADVVLDTSEIYLAVWGYDFSKSSGNLPVYVNYLRRKLSAVGAPELIQAVRGIGYVLRPEVG